jgi:DNA-nicking Smr family endonuclease
VKPRKPSFSFKSFQELRALLENESFSFPEFPLPGLEDHEEKLCPELEKELFARAMEKVIPIEHEDFYERIRPTRVSESSGNKDDTDTVSKLTDLVRHGTGFNVADTPEYIEGTGPNVPPEFARRLHRGDFAIQAHVDLHGFCVKEAREMLAKFMKWALHTGKRGVLIVHGRGLSSPSGAVLKEKVVEWLTRGPWRKWIIAYASARICDGGAGATYVLLRVRPLSKQYRKTRRGKRKGKVSLFEK